MAKPAIHTAPNDNDGWKNVVEGSAHPIATYRTQADARAAGRARAKRDRTEHIVHTRDGKISKRSSYGNDSYPPKG